MVLLIMALVSLIAIYFTRLLSKKGMKAAALAVALLYFYLIVWTYAVFVIDIADLGFSDAETRISLLHGSNIYHSFVDITAKTSVIPLGFLESFVVVLTLALVAGFAVAFHGIFEITKYVFSKQSRMKFLAYSRSFKHKIKSSLKELKPCEIIKINCRMNC